MVLMLDGLQHISEFEGGISIGYSNLKHVDELACLSDVSFLYLSSNPDIEHIEGFRFVKNDRGRLTVSGHRVLENLDGLRSLESINHEVEISYNDRISNLDGLQNVTDMGSDLKIIHKKIMILVCR